MIWIRMDYLVKWLWLAGNIARGKYSLFANFDDFSLILVIEYIRLQTWTAVRKGRAAIGWAWNIIEISWFLETTRRWAFILNDTSTSCWAPAMWSEYVDDLLELWRCLGYIRWNSGKWATAIRSAFITFFCQAWFRFIAEKWTKITKNATFIGKFRLHTFHLSFTFL